jgi:methionyl-tRNA formyltransferase
VRIVFAGTPQVALPSLEALLASDHEVVAVLTRPDAPSGRGKRLTPSPVAERAAELGIETLKPAKPREPEFLARLAEIAPDCCPVVAYGALLPQNLLDLVPHGFVNLHFSLLPAWRGAAPVQHAVLAGDAVTGATTFRIVAALDAGPTFATLTEPIGPSDTSGDLLRRLSVSGAQLLVSTLDGIADGSLTAQEQPSEGVTLAPKITVEDARIDWGRPAAEIDRVIRGCAPSPGAWTTFRGDRFKINSANPVPDQPGAPGELAVTKRSVTVAAGNGTGVELGQVQAQGKKTMLAADWARGVTFTAGEVLGS